MDWYKQKQRAKQKAIDRYIKIYKKLPQPKIIRNFVKSLNKDIK